MLEEPAESQSRGQVASVQPPEDSFAAFSPVRPRSGVVGAQEVSDSNVINDFRQGAGVQGPLKRLKYLPKRPNH